MEWFLPGNKAGGPVKSVYSMLQLLHPFFEFSIICTNRDLGDAAGYKNVKSDTWTKYRDFPVYYFSKEKLKSKNLLSVMQSVQPDIIYLNSFWAYYFSLLPLKFEKSEKIKADVVLAPRGMLGKGALSIKPLKKKLFLSVLKFVNLHSKVIFQATTKEEEKEIRVFFKAAQIRIAPNLNTTTVLKNKKTEKHKGELKLFFLSRISKVKNLMYALDVLAQINSIGKITYDIFGSEEDEKYVQQCKDKIRQLPKNIQVNFKGKLGFEEVQERIAGYHFLFLPTLNENYGHSIAESLKSACPVIISTNTPWSGVNEAVCGFAIDLRNKRVFVKKIEELVETGETEYRILSQNCVKFMKQNSDEANEIKAYKQLFS